MNTIILSQHKVLLDNLKIYHKKVNKKSLPHDIIRNNIEKVPSIIIPVDILRNIKLPRNEEEIISHKERRNKQRIIDRDRNINPYKNYYQ